MLVTMDPVNVYKQFFEAECEANGVARHAVQGLLVAESQGGHIRYYVSLSFFPHVDPEDFGVTYDACWEETLYEAPGRRSKKREEALLSSFREKADGMAAEHGARVFWDRPLGGPGRARGDSSRNTSLFYQAPSSMSKTTWMLRPVQPLMMFV
ncbi:MAG: hypothetical protein IJ856_02730 [Candidatus Methanomethylophilaceae archaeon]|nr:hypothetical protein [Candidatus Methanomethylophilaceae archaeon]